MTTLTTRIQLIAFALVTVLAVGYGTINYFNVGSVVSPPFEVRAQFKASGGIYERADVDLLGIRVGTVREIVPGPGSATTVVLALDHDVKIPRDVLAAVGNKSAIGEQYVELTPQQAGGPMLREGDLIPLDRTTSPIDVSVLLRDLDSLAGSIPTDDLATVMEELSIGLEGVGGTLGHLIDNTDRLTRTSLQNVDDLNTLIEDATVVLGTQVDRGPETASYLRSLAGLTSQLRQIDPSFDDLFANGVRAGVEVSNLLADNQAAIPVLLNHLVSLTNVAADRIPALRKTLVLFPYAVEVGVTGVRRCGSYDAKTGKPVESSCRYDANGEPIYSAYLGMQFPEPPGAPSYFPCTQGYGGTVKYLPNGKALQGGATQRRDSPPNMQAGCTAPVTDPNTPNIRGAQNVPDAGVEKTAGRTAPGWALFDPTSGIFATPQGTFQINGTDDAPPPTGTAGLTWLLNSPME